jgi:hypothetical protein
LHAEVSHARPPAPSSAGTTPCSIACSRRLRADGALRFGQKAMVIGASFVVTCALLGGIVVSRANAELRAAHLQPRRRPADAPAPRDAGDAGTQPVGRAPRRQGCGAGRRAVACDRDGGTELDALHSWQQALPGAPLQQSLQGIRDAWTRAAKDHADEAKSVADHDTAIRRSAKPWARSLKRPG